MLVYARIELLEGDLDPSTRESFWRQFSTFARRAEPGAGEVSENPSNNEMRIKEEMPSFLESYLNFERGERGLPLRLRSRIFGSSPKRITVKVRRISYGSMDLLLEILGISKDTAQDAILSLLEIYLPAAINETFDTTVSLGATIRKIDGEAAPEPPSRTTRVQALITSTFLLPIGLVFAISYIVFGEMRKEMDALKAREDKIISEASNVFSKLLEQNAKLSEIVLDRAKTENEKLKAAVSPVKPGG